MLMLARRRQPCHRPASSHAVVRGGGSQHATPSHPAMHEVSVLENTAGCSQLRQHRSTDSEINAKLTHTVPQSHAGECAEESRHGAHGTLASTEILTAGGRAVHLPWRRP